LGSFRRLQKKSALATPSWRFEKQNGLAVVEELDQPVELRVSADERTFVIEERRRATELRGKIALVPTAERMDVSGRDDADTARPPRSRLSTDHNLYVLIQGCQQVHQAFDGEPCKLVVTKR